MADTHEEQLLSSLLGDIAREDASLQATHLEPRVIAAADASPVIRSKPRMAYLVMAAALVAAAFATTLLRTTPVPAGNIAGVKGDRPAAAVNEEVRTKRPVRPKVRAEVRPPVAPEPPVSESPIAQSPIALSPDEFLPLMPITAQELTGSFQIVHVQLPRASLGALRSPLEQPNELVEADVLLGEDGMARAIRLSTSGSVYPWRSR